MDEKVKELISLVMLHLEYEIPDEAAKGFWEQARLVFDFIPNEIKQAARPQAVKWHDELWEDDGK